MFLVFSCFTVSMAEFVLNELVGNPTLCLSDLFVFAEYYDIPVPTSLEVKTVVFNSLATKGVF